MCVWSQVTVIRGCFPDRSVCFLGLLLDLIIKLLYHQPPGTMPFCFDLLRLFSSHSCVVSCVSEVEGFIYSSSSGWNFDLAGLDSGGLIISVGKAKKKGALEHKPRMQAVSSKDGSDRSRTG